MGKIGNAELVLTQEIPWSCETRENGELNISIALKSCECIEEKGAIKVTKKVFSADSPIVKAERFEIVAGDNTTFVLDQIVSEIPVKIKTHFYLLNDAELKCNVADKNRLVFRANGKGDKLFRLMYQGDMDDILGSSGLMFPDGFSDNGDIRLNYYSGLYNFKEAHTILYGVCTDNPEKIAKWHFLNQDGIVAENPTKDGGYRINVIDDCIMVTNINDADECVTIQK